MGLGIGADMLAVARGIETTTSLVQWPADHGKPESVDMR